MSKNNSENDQTKIISTEETGRTAGGRRRRDNGREPDTVV